MERISTLALQSLMVQSMDELMNRCEKSSGPGAVCALTPVTGPQWPSYSSCIPDRLPWRHAGHKNTVKSRLTYSSRNRRQDLDGKSYGGMIQPVISNFLKLQMDPNITRIKEMLI